MKTKRNTKDLKQKEQTTTVENAITPDYYNNEKGSLYKFAEDHNLNAYEFDIVKRIVRCRKKGLFKQDLEKTKHLIDLYLKESYDLI